MLNGRYVPAYTKKRTITIFFLFEKTSRRPVRWRGVRGVEQSGRKAQECARFLLFTHGFGLI
jgi:hypothetical protein